ncbi:hypothetical protein [Thermoflexibacter ruber]|uniref:Uncharacterized protein n=1 Tax=Thermoflexibacter ruber TaxID=1003 RepID=A0A1I2FA86_9BACT|nr:hypothetical protein [Thermoflexibacter ruber]SFF02364.1 hypothetical protein SAMN04488541_101332 [Thermoflexibacter ruber]
MTASEQIENACREAHEKFLKLDAEVYKDIIEKLQFVIVSYNADKNPIGLYHIGAMALDLLKKHKEQKPRQVSKDLIETLEKALAREKE